MDITIILGLAAFATLVALSAFFSGAETALFSLNQLQQEQMRQAGNPSLTLIERLLAQPRRLIVTILIGRLEEQLGVRLPAGVRHAGRLLGRDHHGDSPCGRRDPA